MIDPRLTQYLDQTGAHLSEVASTVLAPFYRSLYQTGLPPAVCLALTTALLNRMVDVGDVRQI